MNDEMKPFNFKILENSGRAVERCLDHVNNEIRLEAVIVNKGFVIDYNFEHIFHD